ncbi:MAG: hypothetical protein CME25_22510 [Gemmatimonadetes bacterium]|nr:hypothetical protein [Gemmatimonadota bacterium]|tara:strand:- start:4568 stop:5203 length:636 start_codon:yes stop_codon:yes gene_type:complete
MGIEARCWLLLEKSEETRISKGIDGYRDRTGESYSYDSLVPNYKNIRSGDLVIIRKENSIIGYGEVGIITQGDQIKVHRRCPDCNSTDIRPRKTKSPKWKCGKCAFEFPEPRETSDNVRAYEAAIESFVYFENPPNVRDVKSCASSDAGTHSQLSILKLEVQKLQPIMEGVELPTAWKRAGGRSSGQGIGLSYAERRAVELHAMNAAADLY